MRCSICDSKNSRWIFRNYHCSKCEEAIVNAIGILPKNKEEEEYLLEPEFDEGETK